MENMINKFEEAKKKILKELEKKMDELHKERAEGVLNAEIIYSAGGIRNSYLCGPKLRVV